MKAKIDIDPSVLGPLDSRTGCFLLNGDERLEVAADRVIMPAAVNAWLWATEREGGGVFDREVTLQDLIEVLEGEL